MEGENKEIRIEQIKKAISEGCLLIHPERDGGVAVMHPSLNEYQSIRLTSTEYDIYRKAALLTIEEKMERLKNEIIELLGEEAWES